MAKQIMQFRYYNNSEKSKKNQPSNINKSRLVSGSIFADYFPITQLTIQGLPETTFYINDNRTSSIKIGPSGVFKLELEEEFKINSLCFDGNSNNSPLFADENGFVIIDIVYDK